MLVRLSKEDGEASLCGESEVCGTWADVSSLASKHWSPLPRCFFLTGSWEEENGRARGAESHSEKKAICERREDRFMFSQWENSQSRFPRNSQSRKHTHCGCHQRAGGTCMCCNNGAAFKQRRFALLECSFRIIAGWRQGKRDRCSYDTEGGGSAEQREITVSIARHVNSERASADQRRMSSSLKEKKSEDPVKTPAYIARWPLPFWQALAGFIAIGSCSTTAEPLVHF